MQRQNSYELILNSKIFFIPSCFPYLINININIYTTLITDGQYEVKSKVREKIFKKFINYWIYKEIPFIHSDNIFEYDLLSQEFDLMKDLLQIYRKQKSKNQISDQFVCYFQLKQKFQSKHEKFDKKVKNYQQIIDILFNCSGLNTFSSYINVRSELFDACETENIKFVDLYSRTKIESNGLTYVLNEQEKTAGIINSKLSNVDTVVIPRSVFYESNEYRVTIIYENAFKEYADINSIQFSSDSAIEIFDQYCLPYLVKEISIPASVVELRDGWCNRTGNLESVHIDSNNRHFCIYDEKFILAKSNRKSDIYDILLFARRDIEQAIIPSFIRRIAPYAFEFCYNLKTVVFPSDSELRVIDENAFSDSTIEQITIPASVLQINKNAFYFCEQLNQLDFHDNSELLLIDKKAFIRTNLDELTIPSSVVELCEGWCRKMEGLVDVKVMPNNGHFVHLDDKFILGKSNPESDTYDVLLFARRDIEKVVIPSFITKIASGAFDQCTRIDSFEFASDSNLRIIGAYAFVVSSIKQLLIPRSVTRIEKGAFYSSHTLRSIEFESNSELKSVGEEMFIGSGIRSFQIPEKVTQMKNGWCWATHYLTQVKIDPNNRHFTSLDDKMILGKSDPKSDTFDVLVFASRNIEKASIPSYVKIIGQHAFMECQRLKTVEFQSDSQLELIDEFAFLSSSLRRITIPRHVTEIRKGAFCDNSFLERIEFSEGSELRYIADEAFNVTHIESLVVPPRLCQIGKLAFEFCDDLQCTEIQENSAFHLLKKSSFYKGVIMIPTKFRKLYNYS